jgi:hypothetical membrane protein
MSGRALLTCGIVAPLVYAVADLVAGTIGWPGYSFRDQTISELGAIGAPSRLMFALFLVVSYAALTAYGLGIWRAAEDNRNLRLVGGLVMALGVMALTVGQFVAMRTRGTEQGLQGALHLIEGMVAMLLLFGAMGVAALALGGRFRLYTLVTLALVLGFGAWSSMEVPNVEAGIETPWVGVKERIFWYSYQLWFAVLAVTLMRRQAASRSDAGGALSTPSARPSR